jgi:CheY-like chemotaxis protein
MDKQSLLFLAIANRAYGGSPEVVELLRILFQRRDLDAQIELVPESEIVETARRLKPALIFAGYRVLEPEIDPSMPAFGDEALRALKADPETRNIPILMLEAYYDIDRVARECGVDAYIALPFGATEIYDTVMELIGNEG